MIRVQLLNKRVEITNELIKRLEDVTNMLLASYIYNGSGLLEDGEAAELAEIALNYVIPLCQEVRNLRDKS